MTPTPEQLARALISSQRTMVLGTGDPDPWTAPVFYVHHTGRFCFFSSPTSRHIAAIELTGRCAAAIFRDSDDWTEIEGLQMSGRIAQLDEASDAMAVFSAYVERFQTVNTFFDGAFGLDEFAARFRSHLYAFTPDKAIYTNNKAGFGTRTEIQLSI